MGKALEVPLTRKDPEAQLADAILGRGRVLVILDNFEQVVDQATDTVGRWLQRAPEAVFLVTSRTLLRIAGEEVLYLIPLPVPEAVSMFFDRARAVQPGCGNTCMRAMRPRHPTRQRRVGSGWRSREAAPARPACLRRRRAPRDR